MGFGVGGGNWIFEFWICLDFVFLGVTENIFVMNSLYSMNVLRVWWF